MRVIYVAQPKRTEPRANWWDAGPLTPALNVYEPEPQARETGLLDAQGNKLFKVVERAPVGFLPRVDTAKR